MIDNRYAWTSMIRVVTSTHHVKRCNIKPQDTSLPSGGRPGPARFSKVVLHQNTLYIAGAFVDECLPLLHGYLFRKTGAGQVPFDTSDMTYKGQTEQVHLMRA